MDGMERIVYMGFPNNEIEALALLYVERTAEEEASPENYCAIYWDAYERIRRVNEQHRADPIIPKED